MDPLPSPDQFNLRRPSRQGDAVDLAVGEPSIPRALRLLNALFLALEHRGWPVEIRPRKAGQVYERDRVRCTIMGEEFGFRLREKMRMIRLPPEERLGIFDRQVRYEPRGLFELSLSAGYRYAVETWRDGNRSWLEDRRNDVVVGLIVAVEKNREHRAEDRRQEQRRLVAEQRRRERERLEELERARVLSLESLAGRWEKARRLRAFIDAVKGRPSGARSRSRRRTVSPAGRNGPSGTCRRSIPSHRLANCRRSEAGPGPVAGPIRATGGSAPPGPLLPRSL